MDGLVVAEPDVFVFFRKEFLLDQHFLQGQPVARVCTLQTRQQ